MANIESKNLLVAVKAYARANPLPLDKDEVWESLSAAQTYLQSPSAYAGQTIKVLMDDGKYRSYVLQPGAEGVGFTMEEVSIDQSKLTQYVQVVETLPETAQKQGVVYVRTTDSTGHIWNGTEFKQIFRNVETEISALQQLETTKASLSGATFTGDVILANDPTQDLGAVTKQYVDRLVSNLKGIAPGVVDSTHALPESYVAGQTWRVAEIGIYAGKACEAGDLIIAIADGTTVIEDNFIVVQANIDGAVTGKDSSTDLNLVVFDGITGKVIKDSGVGIASLNDAIAKAHTHSNKEVLDSYDKTQAELLTAVDTKITDALTPITETLGEKANAIDVYTKTDVDGLLTPITNNLNTKATTTYVDEEISKALETAETTAKDYTDDRIGIEGSTVKAYVDAAIGTGGTDAAEAVAKALKEAKDYTDTSLKIIEF